MADFIVIAVLLLVIAAAVGYIVKAKKRGVKCIGCPSVGDCPHRLGDLQGCKCCEKEKS